MTLTEALAILDRHRDELRERGARSIAIFGSVARNEATDRSDVDVLIELSRPMGLFGFVRLKGYLEEILGRPVDLTTPEGLRPELRDEILAEAIRAS